MRDEEYLFVSDCREKKSIASSAGKRRTHCGKGGRVRLPSDNMTKKELKAMNGECKSYRLNEPMTWKEFKKMPDELKVSYIKLIRERYNAPDAQIAEMLGVHKVTFCNWTKSLGVSRGKARSRQEAWDKEGFLAWGNGVKTVKEETVEEIPVEEPEAIQEPEAEPIPEPVPEPKRCIPESGSVVFEGKTEGILETLRVLLGGASVHISVTWDVLEEG